MTNMPTTSIEEVHHLECYLNCEFKEHMKQMEKEKQMIYHLCCLVNENCQRDENKVSMKEIEKLHHEVMDKKHHQWNMMKNERNLREKELCIKQKEFRCMLEETMKKMNTIKCEEDIDTHERMIKCCR